MSFTFTKGITNIVVRNPNFGDIRRVSLNDIRRRTTNGDLKTYVSPDWADRTIHVYQFSRLRNVVGTTQIDELKTFFKDNAGIEIDITNHYGDTYTGVIWTPVQEIIAIRPDCSFDLAIEFLENMV